MKQLYEIPITKWGHGKHSMWDCSHKKKYWYRFLKVFNLKSRCRIVSSENIRHTLVIVFRCSLNDFLKEIWKNEAVGWGFIPGMGYSLAFLSSSLTDFNWANSLGPGLRVPEIRNETKGTILAAWPFRRLIYWHPQFMVKVCLGAWITWLHFSIHQARQQGVSATFKNNLHVLIS